MRKRQREFVRFGVCVPRSERFARAQEQQQQHVVLAQRTARKRAQDSSERIGVLVDRLEEHRQLQNARASTPAALPRPGLQQKKMAEIARDAILYGGKDVAKAQKAAEDLLQKLVANGCDEAKAAPLSRKAAASLNEARSVIVVLCGEGDGAQEPNFDRFWRYLKRSTDRVEQLTTAVLDIGDGV